MSDTGRLVISCEDRPGIVAAITHFLFERGANIAQLDQYSTDAHGGRFFLRTVFHLGGFRDAQDDIGRAFQDDVGARFGMQWRLDDPTRPKRLAILASREDHCLLDLLWRWRRGELNVDVGVVISNHRDLEGAVAPFGVPYEHIPVTADTKAAAEEAQLELLAGRYDVVVLARYMQVLSGRFLERVGAPVINIHHSFLPAFAGAMPYQRAKERGVKLVGATAHYVTEELDAGPIIEQDVERVSHADDVQTLIRLGADIERTVLTRAVRWHCDDRVLLHGDTTIVFRP